MASPERLNKFLALQLGISRRAADDLIEKSRVKVDGEIAVLGTRISSDAVVTLNDHVIKKDADLVYLALNKPVGYVCSRRAQGDAPTIYELLPTKYHSLKPVGRLDKDSSGLILLTNDGDFAHRMTHPSFHKIKIYEIELDHPLEPLHQQMISDHGIALEDGVSKFELERLDNNRTKWKVTMSEGRNRQIRRTFAGLGYEVTALYRTQFGPYSLGQIKNGEHKLVDVS